MCKRNQVETEENLDPNDSNVQSDLEGIGRITEPIRQPFLSWWRGMRETAERFGWEFEPKRPADWGLGGISDNSNCDRLGQLYKYKYL